MEQEALRLVGAQGVDLLGVPDGAEGRETEYLGLAPLEEAAAVGPWQESHLAVERAYLLQASPVGALAHVQHPVAELHRDGGFERLLYVVLVEPVSKLADQVVLQSGEPGGLLGLADAWLECVGETVADPGVDLAGHLCWKLRRGVRNFLSACRANELVLQVDDLQVGLLGQLDGVHDDIFGELVRAGLHHQHALSGAGDYEVEAALSGLLVGGVDDELAVDVPDAGDAEGPAEWYVRDGEGGRGARYREQVQWVLHVRR